MGIPDDGRVQALGQGLLRRPAYVYLGTGSYLNHLGWFAGAREIWFGPPAGPMDLRIDPAPMVNYLADPDIYGVALAKAGRVGRAMGSPCLNPPEAVQRSGRDAVAAGLQGIPGVVVPRTERLTASGPHDLARMIGERGMTYPLLIRPVGAHGGKGLLRGGRTLGSLRVWWRAGHAAPRSMSRSSTPSPTPTACIGSIVSR